MKPVVLYTILTALLLLAACASPPASDADKRAAMETAGACVAVNVIALDDGVSDPYSVAQAIRSACAAEVHAVNALYVQHIQHLEPRRRAVAGMEEAFLRAATRAVLKARAAVR